VKALRVAISILAAAGATVLFGSLRAPVLSAIDWFLLAVAYQAASSSFVPATIGGAIAGLVEDLLLHPLKGAHAFSKAFLGYILALVAVRMVFGGALVIAATLAIAELVDGAIVSVLGRLLLGTPFAVTPADVGGSVATGCAGGLLYWAWRFPWKEEWRRRQRRRLR
jgi:cell shape-determining protein MreD